MRPSSNDDGGLPPTLSIAASHGGKGGKGRGRDDKASANISPESVDAYVDEQLKYERDSVITELLKLTKFWFGTEFASKTPAEKHALLWGDEESAEDYDGPGYKYADESRTRPATGRPAASKDGYAQHEEVLDRQAAQDLELFYRAIERDKMGLVSDPHTFSDLFPFRRLVTAPIQVVTGLLRSLARGSVVSAIKRGLSPKIASEGHTRAC